jgi:DNA-binding NtrC family response regulator
VELQTLATSRTRLDRLVKKGRFRPELALTLSTLEIALPPLAQRAEDIPLLAQHFLEAASSATGKQLSGLAPATLEMLVSLPWTRNLDELQRAVREACERATGPRVVPADLPDWVHLAKDDVVRAPREESPVQLDQLLEQIEKEVLSRAMRKARGNKSRAAELVGISRQRLIRRLVQLGLISRAEADEPVVFEPLPEES